MAKKPAKPKAKKKRKPVDHDRKAAIRYRSAIRSMLERGCPFCRLGEDAGWESIHQWLHRELGWIPERVAEIVFKSAEMSRAIAYREAWIRRYGGSPAPNHSAWARRPHSLATGIKTIVKGKKHTPIRHNANGSIWTVSGGLPSLGKHSR